MKDSKTFRGSISSGSNYPNLNSPRWEMSRGLLSRGSIIQEGNFPGTVICGQFSQVGFVRGVIVLGEIILRGNCPGGNVQGAIVHGAIILGGNCPGGNCPRWQLSVGQLSRRELACFQVSYGKNCSFLWSNDINILCTLDIGTSS